MARSRVLAVTAAGSAIVLASLLIASPAQAFTPAAGQKITVPGYFDGVIYDANPADAALTAVGGANAIPDGKHLSAIDVGDDGLGYAIATSFEGGEWLPSYVMPADAKLGTLGAPVPILITSSGGENALGCNSLDMPSPGVLWAACYGFDGDDGYFTYVGNLDPVTGVLTIVKTILSEVLFTALATNPVDGVLYGFVLYGANNDVGPVDLAGANILDPTVPLPGLNPTWGADFDRDGQLFVSAWEFQGMANVPSLSVVDPAAGTYAPFLNFTIGGVELESSTSPPLTVWGPVLPATGPVDGVPLGLAGALLLLAGGAFVVMRRRVEP